MEIAKPEALIIKEDAFKEKGKEIANRLGIPVRTELSEGLCLVLDDTGLSLTDGKISMQGDFSKLLRRTPVAKLGGETVVKAAKMKGEPMPLSLLDATAGMGEDSFLLAAAGFEVTLCERDPVIALLLRDAMERGCADTELAPILARMTLWEGDSIEKMKALDAPPDVILLDPMFPEQKKSGLVKKKFQLLHHLECPCDDEEALLNAAIGANPRKIIIKRPQKGPYLAGRKPNYSLEGSAIRYDCILFPNARKEI